MIVDYTLGGSVRVQQTPTGFQQGCPYHYASKEHEMAERERLKKVVAAKKAREDAGLPPEPVGSYNIVGPASVR